MAFKIGEMFWKVKADTTDFDKNVKGSEASAESFGQKTSSVGSLFKTAFVLAIVAGVGKVSKALILAASEAEEVQNKFDVTFSTIGEKAEETAQDIASSYGVSRTAARDLLAGTGDLLSGFGFTQKSALDLSTTVNQLAGDLASFQNVDIVQASDAITKGLLGEREALKSLGIAITEADIKQLAEDKGIVGELDRQTKANLTLELAVRQSGNAIGDFERSQLSFANQSRIASANVQNLKESLGVGLLPIANAGAILFNQLSGEIQGLVDSFNELIKSGDGAEGIANVLGAIGGALSALKEYAASAFGEIFEAVGDLFEPIQELFAETENGVDIFKILSGVFNVLGGYVKIVGGLWQVLATYLGNVIVFWVKYVDIFIAGAKLIIAYGKALVNPFDKEAQSNLASAAKKFGVSFIDAGKQVIKTFVDTGKKVGSEVTDFVSESRKSAQKYEDAFLEANTNIATATANSLVKMSMARKDDTEAARLEEEKKAANAKKIREKAVAEWLENQEAFNERMLELTGTDEEKLEAKYKKDLELAQKAGADTLELEEYYTKEREKLAAEEAANKKEKIYEQLEAYSGYASSVSDVMGSLIDFIVDGDDELTESKKQQVLAAYRIQQAAAIAQIAIDTATAISRQYADLPLYLAIPASVITAATSAVQLGTVIATPPPYYSGGIVSGTPSGVDSVTASLTPGEEVLNEDDPRHRNNSGGSMGTATIIINLDGKLIAESTINDYANTGRVTIEARAIS